MVYVPSCPLGMFICTICVGMYTKTQIVILCLTTISIIGYVPTGLRDNNFRVGMRKCSF